MRVGVLTPMAEELEAVCRVFPNCEKKEKNGFVYYETRLQTNEVIVFQCGVGKVNAAVAVSILKYEFQVDIVINSGCAGGALPEQKVLDIVIGTELVYTDVDITPLGYKYGQICDEPMYWKTDDKLMAVARDATKDVSNVCYGIIGTSDAFCTKPKIEEMQSKFERKVACTEMEGCGVAHACTKLGIKFLVIRSLSDVPSANAENHIEYRVFVIQAVENIAKVLFNIISKLN
ncbi:MTA/SAH nucleosidase, putative [Entamoeba invadens IP1]|uniref:adenosylhomocysteine nucleosidase n=1 Tax=Entamoeba invadens IP1 TaxID=370355 RepID=A0A0A1U386_ENTIV|nr:MTA/SAH nucleosidase, putative [Entamoeba invadens IP1]ELP88512.1 MTA/SAH nucleosidase, putative [Entamoeba invadens IP1]|eukprot:XP_004255283.1 MTA/SAH nucleosidase, putative [Entamoeba invadens IP1]